MGARVLGAKLTRRIARETEQEVVRAWGNGGYDFEFVTPEHRHGTWNKKSGVWGWMDNGVIHYTSCRELFGEN